MHELSIAQSILDIVQKHLPPENKHLVRTVKLKIGEMAGVVPESLEFCFAAITAETPLAQARLDIERIPLRAQCASCNTVFDVDGYSFACPACSATAVEIISGRELLVTSIDVLEENEENT
jgi:hydrogenase nickel incorporation protein HypA/HybF